MKAINEQLHEFVLIRLIKKGQLADEMGLSRGSISNYLNGKHDLKSESFLKILDKLDLLYVDGKLHSKSKYIHIDQLQEALSNTSQHQQVVSITTASGESVDVNIPSPQTASNVSGSS